MSESPSSAHSNGERTVKCPVEGCDHTGPSRGLHLHVLRKSGGGHGEQNDVPPDLNLANAETVGRQEITVDYPETRKTENVARQCPYCGQVYRGKQGLAIHFGQVVGRKNHPANRDEFPDASDCAIVHVDGDQNIIEVLEADESNVMPSTRLRRQDSDRVEQLLSEIEDAADGETADKVRNLMLAD